MAGVPLPTSSYPGLRPQEGKGRLINAFMERRGKDEFLLRRVPGVRAFAQATSSFCRGLHAVSGVVLGVWDDRLVRIDDDGAATDLGEIAGSGPVYFASNNKSPTPDILLVTSVGVYSCTISGAPTTFVDADLPQPNSICFIDGYFMATIADGRVFSSGLNNTSFATLDFATAEGKPGGLLRGIPFGQQLYLFGPKAIEPWYNAANPEGFPFSRATVIPIGLASATAVAGHEDGFSTALLFVGNDRRVWRIDSGMPQVVSTPDVDRDLASVGDPAQIHALVFSAAGHACWAVTGPDFTWVLDLSTSEWHERASYLDDHWRAKYSVNAFDRWLVADETTDDVGEIDEDYHEEYGNPLIYEVRTEVSGVFPNRVAIARMDADFTVGQGLVNGREPIETRPQVFIDYSKDGGYAFSEPVMRELGRAGESRARVYVNRLGLTGPKGICYRFRVSDPVYVALLGVSHEVEARPR